MVRRCLIDLLAEKMVCLGRCGTRERKGLCSDRWESGREHRKKKIAHRQVSDLKSVEASFSPPTGAGS